MNQISKKKKKNLTQKMDYTHIFWLKSVVYAVFFFAGALPKGFGLEHPYMVIDRSHHLIIRKDKFRVLVA